jgi:hypothetical protein
VVAFFVAITAVSILFAAVILIQLPANYFSRSYVQKFMENSHPVFRWSVIVVKNLIGLIGVILGIIMSLPGVLGPGLITLFIAIVLLDFPGKRKLELKIVHQPGVLRFINWTRKKFSKPPLILE